MLVTARRHEHGCVSHRGFVFRQSRCAGLLSAVSRGHPLRRRRCAGLRLRSAACFAQSFKCPVLMLHGSGEGGRKRRPHRGHRTAIRSPRPPRKSYGGPDQKNSDCRVEIPSRAGDTTGASADATAHIPITTELSVETPSSSLLRTKPDPARTCNLTVCRLFLRMPLALAAGHAHFYHK